MNDSISRQQAIDTLHDFAGRIVDTPNGNYHKTYLAYRHAMEMLPSAQLDIKQAAKLLSDFIESCPGGDSYLITPNGEELRTDWGYAMEGIRLIYDWAERRSDG